MKRVLSAVDRIPLGIVVVLGLTLGLAPFTPPHLVEKLSMLAGGTLVKPIDWFDLLLHGTPWLLLILKLIALAVKKPENQKQKIDHKSMA